MTDLFTTNFEKYSDTAMYDQLNEHSKIEIPILLQWIKKENQLLELACGTGRLTIPLAEKGYNVTGVDLHEGMLKKAKEKAAKKEVAIPFYLQDCTQLSFPNQFECLFMVGNSFQHFLTNQSQDALLASVSKHLTNNGLFIFDTRNPILAELSKPDHYVTEFQDYRGYDVKEHHLETYEDGDQLLRCHTNRKYFKNGEYLHSEQDSILLRYTYPLEMARLLASHGFKIEKRYGNWKGDDVSTNAPQMIFICRK
ncbi:class I SAM-dependent methyltransferase [Shouchella patagoniensis]|uniref:class I SAM-dependent methyltransferase n=1 Tax=Shouchella patagoniensis TaxID=228576 RepID=UPI000994B97B|nr:class I SAM-dependent methyltransferase [Shouchella patagoniensis]